MAACTPRIGSVSSCSGDGNASGDMFTLAAAQRMVAAAVVASGAIVKFCVPSRESCIVWPVVCLISLNDLRKRRPINEAGGGGSFEKCFSGETVSWFLGSFSLAESGFDGKMTGFPGDRNSDEAPDWHDLFGGVKAGRSEDVGCMLSQVGSNTEQGGWGVR